ncbi:hypothetical protein ACJMK2_010604 [Sinanodonta woodiana]|uniref:CUB domain-containing protein n=1 Tax=Sinanodonta woodiana TaxID=1069815 RepID=A0ABD3VIU5_SINWO
MTRHDHYTCLITCVFALFSSVQVAAISTYKMDLLCGREISLELENIYTGIVRFRFSSYLESNKNCSFILSAEISSNHISFYFASLNIGPTSDYGYLVAQDGRFQSSAKIKGFPEKLCGYEVSAVAANRYFSWGSTVRFQFVGTERTPLSAGFDIVFTRFDDSPCSDNYYKCDNGHCIMSDLRCSGSDPCGDGSDCKPEGLSGGQTAGIAIGSFIGLLMIIFVVIFLFCCRKKSNFRRGSYTARVAFGTQARQPVSNTGDGNQTSTADPVVYLYGQGISDLPPPYEQVVNEGGSVFPSGSDFVFKDLPTYEEATAGQTGFGENK